MKREHLILKKETKKEEDKLVDKACRDNASRVFSELSATGVSRDIREVHPMEDVLEFRSVPFALPGKKVCRFHPKHDRYMNVLPYEHSRVRLVGGRNDYINACHVRSDAKDAADFSYIATQGPLEETAGDFWAMVWQQDVTAVVMLCDLVEDMMPKCAKYFPFRQEESFAAGALEVTALLVESFCPGVEHRVLEISETATGRKRKIDHFRYSDWPDHGIPDHHGSILEMSRLVRRYHPSSQVVVHCSAGIGRTGTFCMIDIALRRLKHAQAVDFNALLVELRSSRLGMVQTWEQYYFAQKCCWTWIKASLQNH